jgi:hydrogenase maturation protease
MTNSEHPLALVVGIGNPDRGDDGFGSAVARRLRAHLPSAVHVLELGGDTLALIEDWNGIPFVIVIDAVAPINEPGRVYRLDLTHRPLPIGFAPRSTHAFGLAETIELARGLGRLPPHFVAYLVEGGGFETGAPLSPAVANAVETVAERTLTELSAILRAKGDAGHA